MNKNSLCIDKPEGLYYLILLNWLGFQFVTPGEEMASKEEELIQRLMRENEDFLKAKQAHAQLAKQLELLENKSFLTPQDEIEIKILKKKKLAYKDQMEKILVQYR